MSNFPTKSRQECTSWQPELDGSSRTVRNSGITAFRWMDGAFRPSVKDIALHATLLENGSKAAKSS